MSSWSCGAPLVVIMAVPGHPQLCPPTCPRGRVVSWPSSWVPPWSSLWPCGACSSLWSWGPPLVVVMAVQFPLAIGALPCSSSSPWVPSRPWVSLFVPWCPAWLLVLPGHWSGCVVAMWCPPAHPRHRECPPPLVILAVRQPSCSSSWPCGVPPVVVVELVPSPACPCRRGSLPLVPEGMGAYVRGVCPTPQPPPIGCGCGGCFVVVMVVMEMKGRAVNRENTYYIRMPHHYPAHQSGPLTLFEGPNFKFGSNDLFGSRNDP